MKNLEEITIEDLLETILESGIVQTKMYGTHIYYKIDNDILFDYYSPTAEDNGKVDPYTTNDEDENNTNYFYIYDSHIWNSFHNYQNLNHQQIEDAIKKVVEKHYNLKNIIIEGSSDFYEQIANILNA